MLSFINLKDFFLFVVYFAYAVLVPGYLFSRALLQPKLLRELLRSLPSLEKNLLYRYFYFLFTPATGLVLVDAVVLLLARLHYSLSYANFFVSFSLINIALLILNIWFIRSPKVKNINSEKLKKFALAISLIFLVSVVVRTVFYLPNAVPQDTDLGHHMYWSQWMVQKETFPAYNTPEVIEGEHMIFAVVSKLSGITLLSAMPLIILSLYNLAMLLALSFGALTITGNKKIALWTLFFSGIYFAVDPPQARYIKGGVIGNTFGNLFIPLVFMLVFLFFRWYFLDFLNRKKEEVNYKPIVALISLILVILGGSFYSHHLSTFLLGITLAFSLLIWFILALFWSSENQRKLADNIKLILFFFKKTLLTPKFLITAAVIAIYPIFIYLPHYLASNAVKTVTQDPEKDTHLGISLGDFWGKMGWTRFALLFIALAYFVFILAKRTKIAEKWFISKHLTKIRNTFSIGLLVLIFGWFLPLALLSFFPGVFKVDLPSRRVVNYLVFPSVILVSIAAAWIFANIKNYQNNYIKWALALIAVFVLWDGSSDFRSVYTGVNKFEDAIELYNASKYLADETPADAIILKDHRTLAGDSWIKFFLLRGYDYFLSRTYDYKYNDPSNKLDPCTREVVMVPESSVSLNCYGQTGINYVIVKPAGDEFLFWKSQGFNAVYYNEDIAIFQKK